MKNYKECTKEPYSFWVNDANLQSGNHLRFRYNIFG